MEEWTDSRVEDDIKKETAIIESIISALSCVNLKKSERILKYCITYLRDRNSKSEFEKDFKDEILKKLKIIPTEE